jgi:hypothetical protein
MAGIKISELPAVGSAILTDFFPVVQAGTTSRETLSQVVTLFNTNIQLASTAQVTGLSAALAGFLPLSGGTMTGVLDMGMHKIINLTDPTNPQDATTKAYVDTFASGLTVILAAQAATTANLNATPAGAGVGATLTNAGAMAAFAVDGYSANLNDRILVKDQTLTQHNGIYTVTTVGSGAVNWVLTRATDYDQAAEIKPGTLVAVNNGTVNATTSWLETATVVTVDTDPVLFSQFTFSPTSFFKIVNNLSEGVPATMRTNLGLTGAATMTLPVSGANGGTGINNGANTITLGGNILTAGALTLAGAFASTFTFTGATNVTFPTTGTLLTSAQPTINQPNIVGTTTNDSAAAGSVGEFISSVIASGAAVSVTSNVVKNVTSIALTAGDWDVWGNVTIIYTSSAVGAGWAWISTTSATLPDASLYTGFQMNTGSILSPYGITVLPKRISIAVPTTVFLSVKPEFASGTATACGGIYARRRR